MRYYANYKYNGQNINNLGDHIQILTIDYLYSLMGIKKEDIVYIDINDLGTYNGKEVYLPVSMPLVNYSEHGLSGVFSSKIHPVFFGVTTPKQVLLPEEIEYFQKCEPVGCRDEQAYNTMVKYGIKAYLGGCLTVTLPKRTPDPEKQKKVFIVDVPDNFKKFIPDDIAQNAIWDTHIFYNRFDDPTKVAAERYNRYQNEAKLLITGLLHGAVPCAAFGIPVILARDCMSYRFAWLESLLQIYTPESYSSVNWNPEPVNFEEHKKQVRNLFVKRMSGQTAADEIEYVHNFYINREKHEYVNDVFFSIQNFIDTTWTDHNAYYQYAVWGLTHMAEITVDYISERYPNAKLTHVYDINTEKSFRGIKAVHPDNIAGFPDETVFVTTVSAAEPAKNFFNKIGKQQNKYKTLEIIR